MPSSLGISLFALVLANLCVALYMTGVIWFVQIVHYPLFAHVGTAEFIGYEKRHASRTSAVVAVPMIFELAVSILLGWVGWTTSYRAFTSSLAALVLAIWLSTFLLQVPCHNRLATGYSARVHQRLTLGNWLRTVAWTMRSMLLLVLLCRIAS